MYHVSSGLLAHSFTPELDASKAAAFVDAVSGEHCSQFWLERSRTQRCDDVIDHLLRLHRMLVVQSDCTHYDVHRLYG